MTGVSRERQTDHRNLGPTEELARAHLDLRREVGERKRAEESLRRSEAQLLQAQKMDAIGQLAGGIAHDFNNLLTIILSCADLGLGRVRPGDPQRLNLEAIRDAAERAASLTRQLLAFSRRQVLQLRIVDLNDVVARMEDMLRRVVGDSVELAVRQGCSCRVNVDPGQMEQVLMNLAVNARDAMPGGGKLTIETADIDLDEQFLDATDVGLVVGPHVMLAVTDTGTGMDDVTRSRIFEPFFTTKEPGKGTGLGLSTVFGIVKQSGGSILVDSEPGKGTTFKLYFPRVDGAEFARAPTGPPPRDLKGTETILLVEDEERVRKVADAILRDHGYQVLEAQGSGDALMICEQHPAAIHLLLTDVVMPRLSGPKLAQRLVSLRPAMKVLFMSGHANDPMIHDGLERGAFLEKPFTPESLARKVRHVLDNPA